MALANIMVQLFALAVTLLLLACNRIERRPNDKIAFYMDAMLWSNVALLVCFIVAWLLEGKPQFTVLIYILTAGKSGFGFIIAGFYTYYIGCSVENLNKISKNVIHIIASVCVIAMLLNFVSIFNGMYFSCQDGYYVRGPLFLLNQFFSLIILIPDTFLVILYRKSIGRRATFSLISYIILPLIAAMAQYPIPQFDTMCIATTLSLLIIYITIQIERNRKLAEKEKELTDARVAVMLSQIQPHFLYNALSVIQDLCHGKAPEAEQAAIEFAEFLRCNLDSLKADKPIKFDQELKHTRNYLALEARRFDDRLRVEYDVKTTAFCLPALTLQPIVENAVRYGTMKRIDGGVVKISTIETEDFFIITVEDDGMGFDINEKKSDGRTHIGIANVRERIQLMCDGELFITSAVGVGTIAQITLPKEVNACENTSSGR